MAMVMQNGVGGKKRHSKLVEKYLRACQYGNEAVENEDDVDVNGVYDAAGEVTHLSSLEQPLSPSSRIFPAVDAAIGSAQAGAEEVKEVEEEVKEVEEEVNEEEVKEEEEVR